RAHVWDRPATECAHIVRSEGGVAHNHLDGFERNRQLFRDNLRERRTNILTNLHLSGVYRYVVILAHMNPRMNAVVVGTGDVGTIVRQRMTRDECYGNSTTQVAEKLPAVNREAMQRRSLKFVLFGSKRFFTCPHRFQVVLMDRMALTIRG